MRQKPINEKIGTWVCGGGGVADVYQTKKQGKHFYTRCDCCGLVQGTGKALQQRIYDTAKFIDKSAIAVPSGVDIGAFLDAEVGQEFKQTEAPVNNDKQQSEAVDFDPTEIEESEPVRREGVGFFKKIVPFFVVAAAVGVGAWMG